jgi:hypothetical protein
MSSVSDYFRSRGIEIDSITTTDDWKDFPQEKTLADSYIKQKLSN